MYLLNDEIAKELSAINERIHNFDELGMYLDSVYVIEPITSMIDKERLTNKLDLVTKCATMVEKLYKEYVNIRYIRQQLIMFKYELDIIKRNIVLILRKKSIEDTFSLLFGVSDISWNDFELLYTEYSSEVLNIDNVSYRKLIEMYEIILGKPHMTLKEFLSHCTACGGDWCSMLLSGIKECYPNDYDRLKSKCDTINSNNGSEEFCLLCNFLSTVITNWKELE